MKQNDNYICLTVSLMLVNWNCKLVTMLQESKLLLNGTNVPYKPMSRILSQILNYFLMR
jgi:hypothetical protein